MAGKTSWKNIGLSVGAILLLFVGCVAVDLIPHSHAKPPKTVIDLSSWLAWRKEPPRSSYQVFSGTNIYYLLTAPAGRYLASGPSGYAFDEQGRFVTWTSDIGDFKHPPEIFGDTVKKERITLDEIKARIASTNKSNSTSSKAKSIP